MRIYLAAACLLLAFLAIYLPDLGHGFIKDDFGWIGGSRVASPSDAVRLFERNVGFYRPLVSASFAADYRLWGLDPFGYGISNLVIFFIDAILLFALARNLLLPRSAALLAVSTWAFNFHGVNMALLWISGRTALLMCLCALAAARAVLSRRHVLGGILALLAMLCKEEAVLLPVLFAVFNWSDGSDRSPRGAWQSVRDVWPMWIALMIYLSLRVHSGAFGPQTAPSYYQFSFAPLTVLRNILEYLDRGATAACAVLLIMWLFVQKIRLNLNPDEKRVLIFASIWFVSFYAITVFLPVRSDLYALTPSVGSAMLVGALGSAARRISAKRFKACCVALTGVVVLLIPIYRQRNERWVASADLSADVIRSLTLATNGYNSGQLVLIDDPSARFGLESSFGTLFGNAVRLTLGPTWTGEVTQSIDKNAAPTTDTKSVRLIFVLRRGHLIPAAVD